MNVVPFIKILCGLWTHDAQCGRGEKEQRVEVEMKMHFF